MKFNFLISAPLSFLILLCFFCAPAPVFSQSVQWAATMGGTGYDDGYAVTRDGSGNIYATGFFSVTATFGAFTLNSGTGGNVFVVKMNESTGSVLWAKKFGGTGSVGYAVTTDAAGNLFLSGNFFGTGVFGSFTLASAGFNDGFIAKLDPAGGNVTWITQFKGPGDEVPYSLACDAAGNIFAAGSFFNSVEAGSFTLTSSGSRDVFAARLNTADGTVTWIKKYGGTAIDEARSIFADNSGNIYNTGGFEGTASFGSFTLTSLGAADIFSCHRRYRLGETVRRQRQ
jgi:hypothetical protein